jgi:hypothetical protein
VHIFYQKNGFTFLGILPTLYENYVIFTSDKQSLLFMPFFSNGFILYLFVKMAPKMLFLFILIIPLMSPINDVFN